MSHVRHFRHIPGAWAGPGVVAAFLLSALCGSASAAPPVDPVEELRQALPFQIGDDRRPIALQFRRDTLEKRVAAIKSIGDMRRALVLTEWKDTLGSPRTIQEIDQFYRTKLGHNFKDALNLAVDKGDTTSRLAVATMLGEIGASVRALTPTDLSGFGRELAPILIRLTTDRDAMVRATAARALGRVNPMPGPAAAALKTLLEKGTVAQRRAAADGLVNLVLVPSSLQKKGQTQTGVEASRTDVLDAAREAVAASGAALKDTDVQVRRLAIEAMFQAASAFRELVPDAYSPTSFPPRGRPLEPGEAQDIAKAHKKVEQDLAGFDPIIQAAKGQARTLAQALTDSDSQVRERARQALEMYGNARLRMRRLAESVPELPTDAPAVQKVRAAQKEGKQDDLTLAILPGLEVIQRGVRDPNVQVRRSTLDFLESLEENSAPAIPAIVGALSDPDRFVRWAAARTLGKIGPIRTEMTVPALARLLQDPDLDVSLIAQGTLRSFGFHAKAAVPALIEATRVGDAEGRVGALQTLASVGAADAAVSIPAVIAALGNSDIRVRKAAAETLGSFGGSARVAVAPLRGLLQDEDPDVRRAASDALLNIQPTGR
jgi:HEAT repeat protein